MAGTQQELCRVQVTIPGHVVDVPLHTHLPIADTVAELIPYLVSHLEAKNKDTAWLKDPDAYWHLTTIGNQPLDEDKTLAEEKVLDGDRLFLTKTDPGEKHAPLIDDVAESITYYLKRNFPSWDSRYSKRVALTMIPAVVALIGATALVWANAQDPSLIVRGALCGGMAVVGLICATIAVVLVRTARDDAFKAVPVPLMMTTYLLVGAAALIVTPRPLGIYQLVAAGSVLLTVSVCMSVMTRKNLTLHYAVIAGSVLILIVGLLNFAYRSPTAVIGVQQITLCFFLILIAPRLALAVARISLPYVPATGEPFMRGTGAGSLDAGSLPRDETSGDNASIFNQQQQTLTAYACRVGLMIGALAVLVATSWTVGRNLDTKQWLIWAFMAVITTCLVARGKSIDDAREQGIVLIAAASTLGAFGAGLLTSATIYNDNTMRGAIALGFLAAAMLLATLFAIQERRIVSPIVTKVIELFEKLLFVAPLPFVVFAMDLYSKARAR